MKGGPIPADLLDAESSREQKSCSAQNQQPEILLFSHCNKSEYKGEWTLYNRLTKSSGSAGNADPSKRLRQAGVGALLRLPEFLLS